MSCAFEPVIWSCDTGLQIPCFDRHQLIITWMSNITELLRKPRLHHVSVNPLFGVWCHVARLRCHCHRVYVPTSNAAGHDNHEKVNSWVSFSFLCEYGAPLSGPLGCWSSAIVHVVWNKLLLPFSGPVT